MSAGTLALTNGSTTVTGSSTVFQTDLAVNDFIVCKIGGTTYTLGVSTIGSNTALTLTQPFTGPTTTGVAWYAVPNQTLVGITTELAANLTTVYRSVLINDANWTQVFSQSGDITVTLKDGSTFTGPSWRSITTAIQNKADKTELNAYAKKGANSDITSLSGLTTALSIGQGGTGAANASSAWINLLSGRTAVIARNDLQLTSAATSVVQSSVVDATAGALLINGAWGLGGSGVGTIGWSDLARQQKSAFVSNQTDSPVSSILFMGVNCSHDTSSAFAAQFAARGSYGFYWRTRESTNFNAWRRVYDDGNTTKASDGTLKAASPVVRIVMSKEANKRTDVDETGFHWCGCGTANEEAEGVSISRLDTGVYVLAGSAGLASEGWQLLPPRDPQGSGDLGIVEAEQTESGGLTIRLYKRRYKLSDDGDIEVAKGILIDVPENSWIDVRLDMPEDSAYKLKQEKMQQAVMEQEPEADS